MRSTLSRWRRLRISSQSRHSERTVRTKRSAIAFAFGDRDRVRLRRSDRRLHDPDAFAVENLVEGAAVLAVAVADEEADALFGEVKTEVARLLGYPGAAGIPRAAGKPDAPAAVADEEQRVVAAQEHALAVKKSHATMLAACACRNSRQLGPACRGSGSSRSRARRRRMLVGDTRKPSLPSSPQIRLWPQRGFSRASCSTSSRTSAGSSGRPRRPEGCRHVRRTSARCQRSSVRGVTSRALRTGRGR
jgi:hypothetical protein